MEKRRVEETLMSTLRFAMLIGELALYAKWRKCVAAYRQFVILVLPRFLCHQKSLQHGILERGVVRITAENKTNVYSL